MDLLVALQTHSVSNNQDELAGFQRYGCNNKSEVTKRCVRSLVASLNYAVNNLPNLKIRLNVFDDHSDSITKESIKEALSKAVFDTSFIELEERGLIPSLRECYLNLKEQGAHLVMQAQDDYLFHEKSFFICLQTYYNLSSKFAKPITLLPFDDPYRYWDHNITPVRIILGPDRHWRQIYHTPCTFLTHHQVVIDNWDLFDKIAHGNSLDPKLEDDSINKMWQDREYIALSPIPSLALHFQTETEKDPYINWREWWDKHEDVKQDKGIEHKLSIQNKKKVLNVGCGTVPLNTQSGYFNDWVEIRADMVENSTTDVVTSLTKLENIPAKSVDCVWASHVVEHCLWQDLPSVFNNIMRVLKDDGFAVIRVPDIGSIAHLIPNNLLDTVYDTSGGPVAAIDMLYGGRFAIESHGEFMCHKTGFTPNTLEYILNSFNIKSVIRADSLEVQAFLFKDEFPSDALTSNDIIIF